MSCSRPSPVYWREHAGGAAGDRRRRRHACGSRASGARARHRRRDELSRAPRGRPAIIEALDVSVICSDFESTSLFALEAMTYGAALVCTDVGGLRELLTDGVNGLLVPPRAPAELAGAILRVADDADQRERLGAAATARASEFSAETLVDRYDELYRSLLAKARSRRGGRARSRAAASWPRDAVRRAAATRRTLRPAGARLVSAAGSAGSWGSGLRRIGSRVGDQVVAGANPAAGARRSRRAAGLVWPPYRQLSITWLAAPATRRQGSRTRRWLRDASP